MKYHIVGKVIVTSTSHVEIDEEFEADSEEKAEEMALDAAEDMAEFDDVDDTDWYIGPKITCIEEDPEDFEENDRKQNYRMMVASGAPRLPGFEVAP